MNTTRKVTITKNNAYPYAKLRFTSQLFSLFIVLWIGIEFYLFVNSLENSESLIKFSRPAGVEAFLPISALMSFLYFIYTGIIHTIHPAGFIIFTTIILISFVVSKSFCSWICPIGFISELTGSIGKKMFKIKWKLPRFLDYPLRALKYILLAFFLFVILPMPAEALEAFLDSPYNQVADIKMLEFFTEISTFSFIVILTLVFLSVFIENFWCRYLCPYGGLLGLIGMLGILRIKRNSQSCIDCNLCAKVCPSRIKVDKITTVKSDECTSCFSCLDACPVKDTLVVSPVYTKFPLSTKFVALFILLLFWGLILSGIIGGIWQNSLTPEDYQYLYDNRHFFTH